MILEYPQQAMTIFLIYSACKATICKIRIAAPSTIALKFVVMRPSEIHDMCAILIGCTLAAMGPIELCTVHLWHP